ncbi:YdeI/OmpD-associated family protein [Rhizosphaericola mali]|uniref:YdhG-like domain-containing protein n=1 Tax=Rhizosphaericola mali TaxID=2545455 RepID=A0A5P2G4C9_9BACT|nr:DUF1801 domain-containing protein [Rhizosphaericola mali]QES90684.1 hypothetical protein E0W69_019170 [Rhizosphaericola mali]
MKDKIALFFENEIKWKAEFLLLRTLLLQHKSLQEEYKWMHPCYTLNGKNVIIIHGFKEYCALLFFKGSLLEDNDHVLIQQTKNVQAARQIRFTNITDIQKLETTIDKYIQKAIDIESSGQKVILKKVEEFAIPNEFKNFLESDPKMANAFSRLTPGRQKAYLHFFNQAKQSKTRLSRIDKFYNQILEGKGLND